MDTAKQIDRRTPDERDDAGNKYVGKYVPEVPEKINQQCQSYQDKNITERCIHRASGCVKQILPGQEELKQCVSKLNNIPVYTINYQRLRQVSDLSFLLYRGHLMPAGTTDIGLRPVSKPRRSVPSVPGQTAGHISAAVSLFRSQE